MKLLVPSASPEEAAAIVAALERFMRATAPASRTPAAERTDRWRRTAILEAVSAAPSIDAPGPWGNT